MTDKKKIVQAAGSAGLSSGRDPYVALKEKQYVPFFQPLITLRTGQLAGFEMLARWQHPTDGIIPPIHFIQAAERDGWIGELNRQILPKAFEAIAAVSDKLTLAINVSPLSLRDASLPEQLRGMAAEAGFCMSRLIVEITESALIDDLTAAAKVVAELKAMGCKLALDDFGTGYSSLLHLQCLPFDKLKVDRSFVSSMAEKRQSRKIVSAVVGLGQSLGMVTVAEGIETQEQAEMLFLLGCELGQGYFFGRPMPVEQLTAAVFAPREKVIVTQLSAWNRTPIVHRDVSPSQRLSQLQAVYDGAPVGLAFIDQNLRYLNLNKKLADMNGASVEDHLGSHVSEMIPELFPVVEPYLNRALQGEVISDVEVQFPNSEITRLISYQPAFDESGEVVGVALALTDITERKRTEEALKTSEAYYRNAVELNPELLWIMDRQGRNLDVRPRWHQVTGRLKPKETDYDWLALIHPEDLQKTVRAIADHRERELAFDVEFRAADGKGGWRWRRSRGSPRFDVQGKVFCWYGCVHDIDAPSKTRSQGSVPEEDKSSSHKVAVARLPGGPVDERRRQALLDLEILDTPAEAEFNDLVVLAAEICAAPICMISLIDSQRVFLKATVGMDLYESPTDLSFCKHTVEQHGLMIVEDATKDERFQNNPFVLGEPKIRFYAGMPLHAGEGITVGTLCVVDMVPRTLSPGQATALTILAQQVQTRMEMRSERRMLLKSAADNAKLTRELQVSNEALVEANHRLEQLATTDALTGLLNRRAFEDRISAEFVNAQRKGRTLSLLVMDIDDFKKRTDEFGHAAGEEALRHAGAVLRKIIRATDYAAKIGGEQFAIVLPETSLEAARILAKRVRALLGLGCAEFPCLTVSIGISSMESTTRSWEALFAEAKHGILEETSNGMGKPVVLGSRYVA